MFYTELSTNAGNNIADNSNFNNEQASEYWLDTEYEPFAYAAWYFSTKDGSQFYYPKDYIGFAWVTSPGNIAVVPAPSAIWMMGISLLGLFNLWRRKQ